MKKLFLALIMISTATTTSSAEESVKKHVSDSFRQADSYKDEALTYVMGSGEETSQRPKESSLMDMRHGGLTLTDDLPKPLTPNDQTTPLEQGATCSNKVCRGNAPGLEKEETNSTSELIIFVSFSMPDESIKNYAQQAKRVGGRLVVIGLIADSFQKTQQKLMNLGVELDIDPNLFEQHTIAKVPTIILTQESREADRIIGHVSLEHALDEFAAGGNVSARDLLNKLNARES